MLLYGRIFEQLQFQRTTNSVPLQKKAGLNSIGCEHGNDCLQESYARQIGIESILNTCVRTIVGGILSTNIKV